MRLHNRESYREKYQEQHHFPIGLSVTCSVPLMEALKNHSNMKSDVLP